MGEAKTVEYRTHLPVGDLEFIAACLADSPGQSAALLRLLTDPGAVDEILDHPKLLEIVLDGVAQLKMSPRLYFYLITRHSLKSAGLDDPELADYVSGVLAAEMVRRGGGAGRARVFYLVDWLAEFEKSPPERHFDLYVMAGNRMLFLTGIFPHFIDENSRRRGAPGLAFYEEVGRHSFRSASRHPRCRPATSEGIYDRIARHFPDLRQALNDASERLLHLDAH